MSRLPSLGPRGEGWVAIQAVILVAIAGAGFAGLAAPAWAGPEHLATAVVGGLGIVAGGILAIRGLVDLRENLTALPHPRPNGRLVETGAYRLVRHPIYGGLVLGAVGWGLASASPATIALALVLLGFFDLKSRREEAWLTERYAGYSAYRARTHRLVPWLY